jgi:hypothetical protein
MEIPHSKSQKAPPRVLSQHRSFLGGFWYKRICWICYLVRLRASLANPLYRVKQQNNRRFAVLVEKRVTTKSNMRA